MKYTEDIASMERACRMMHACVDSDDILGLGVEIRRLMVLCLQVLGKIAMERVR